MEESLKDKFNELSSIHFSTPQFSYVPSLPSVPNYLKKMVEKKKSSIEKLIDLKKSTLEKLVDPARYQRALEKILDFKNDAIETILNSKKEKENILYELRLGDVIDFKKSALHSFLNPKKEVIEDIINAKRTKLQEIGSQFPGSEVLREKLLRPLKQAYNGLREGLEASG